MSSWEFFDSIRCINLVSRPDRYEIANSLFHERQIPVEFYKAVKHPNGGLQGCFESHVNVIREAYEAGCENVLIFEDDLVTTSKFDESLLAEAIDFMKANNDWDLFYLGAFPEIKHHKTSRLTGDERESFPNIYKLHSLCGHAYVVSRRFMEKFKDAQFTGIPLDYIYVENNHSYAVYPSLFAQGASVSDNNGNVAMGSFNIDTMPKVKQTFFRAMEMYGYHVNAPAIWIPIILLVIWAALVFMYPQYRIFHISFLVMIILLMLAVAK